MHHPVEECTQSDQPAQGVIGRKADGSGSYAACGLCKFFFDPPDQCMSDFPGNIEADIQIVVER